MKILFMSLMKIQSLEERNIYSDLLRVFVEKGHYVRVVSPVTGEVTRDVQYEGYSILQVETAPIQKMNLIKKGLATLQIAPRIKNALKQHCAGEKYDLILMATPPITLVSAVNYIKRRDGAKVYLLLKDIWPQGIADLGAISHKGPVYWFFQAKEKKLYAMADKIGCMSQANIEYILQHHLEVTKDKVELCPNSVEPEDKTVTPERRQELRERYGIPLDKKAFIYGGNLGRPQGIPFLIDCLRANVHRESAFFVVCGTGTEYSRLRDYVDAEKPGNVLLINGLPKEDYEDFVSACDVGMIFLDYRFTIPNFPSRLLSYMQSGLPVLCCTDPNTDIGDVAAEGGFGWKCMSNDVSNFCHTVDVAMDADLTRMGEAGRQYLMEHYTAEKGYHIIVGEQEKNSGVFNEKRC